MTDTQTYPMLPLVPSSAAYDSPSGDGWGKFFLGILGGIALAIGTLVLMNLNDDQSTAPPYVTQEELQNAISTIGRSLSSRSLSSEGGKAYGAASLSSEEGKAHKAAAGSSSRRSIPIRSASSSKQHTAVAVPGVSSHIREQVVAPSPMPESSHMWVRTVRWTWPVPVVPSEGQGVVGRILFRNSCAGPLTISRIRMAYSGPNPFLIRGVALVDTSDEPRTELTPLVLNTSRKNGDVELLLDPPVELEPCERDPTVPFGERTDLFSMDIVVEAGIDQSDWSVHTLYFVPEWVTVDGRVVWDEKVNPAEGVFQFFTGKDTGEKSQEPEGEP